MFKLWCAVCNALLCAKHDSDVFIQNIMTYTWKIKVMVVTATTVIKLMCICMLCFIQGRGGKGNVFVFAAGNKGPSESCSCNGYVTSIYTIAVTAATERNTPS